MDLRSPDISSPRAALRRWLIEQSLPLWGEVGWDAGTGLFVERLDPQGRPLVDVPRRLLVQARQIFAFGVAARRGWYRPSEVRLERAADAMARFYLGRGGSPGWCFSVDASGDIVDPRRDVYTLAFVLLALATLVAVGDARARERADETLTFLDRHMAHPDGGYVSGLTPSDRTLRQNPHMHLFEALLALHEAAPDGDYLDRASRMAGLLERRFLQGAPPVLAEDVGEDWSPRRGPDIPFEPGHHFEWVWLLARHAAMSGGALPGSADLLWATAVDTGIGPRTLIYDEASVGRGALRLSTRLWPYCEAAKAAHVRSQAATADSFLDALQRRFLRPAHPGSWIDHLDPSGKAKTDFAPASSLYHICCAADVLDS